MPDDLTILHESARARVGDEVWLRLSAHEQTQAVYQEMRAHDAARVAAQVGARHHAAAADRSGTASESVVHFRLVGQMEAWTVSADNILPTGRKTRGLLAAIALMAPRPALRARLAELLWSRRPEDQARASLRQEIQLLLKALAPARTEILRVTRDHLSLAPGVAWIDVEEIMRSTANRPAALALVDGDLLEDLDGVDPGFDSWLVAERERVRDRARAMAEVLLRQQTVPASIVAAARRLLQIDRAHEEAWRATMRAHANQGERGMAIQAYDRCRAVLADMLDTAPSAETQTLLNEIRGPSSKRLPTRPPRPDVATEVARDAGADEVATDTAPRDSPRVGVLPLRGVGTPPDIAYFGPGLANEITTALSRFRSLSVVSSASLAHVDGQGFTKTAIRNARGIDFLLDGAIQRSRGRFRVTLRLLDLREDNQVVWAKRFDRSSDDPLAAQEEISAEVAAQIDPVMLMIEAKRSAARTVTDPSAYDLILLAVPHLTRLERTSFMRAGGHLERAVSTFADHAEAHKWYAVWHLLLVSQHWTSDPREAHETASRLADLATALDPYSAGAYSTAGHTRAVAQRRPLEAATLHQRALHLNPHFAGAWAMAAITQAFLGEVREAERLWHHFRVLSAMDPFAPIYEGQYAIAHIVSRDYQAAATMARTATQLNPEFSAGYKPYLAALGHSGHIHEASSVLRRLQSIEPGITVERCFDTFPLTRQTDRDHFAEGLRLAGVP